MDGFGPGLPPWLAFSLGSLGGLAALLRSGRHLTRRRVWATILYNGLASVAIAWGVAQRLEGDLRLIGALCILSGIGGATVLDFVVAVIRTAIAGTWKSGGSDPPMLK